MHGTQSFHSAGSRDFVIGDFNDPLFTPSELPRIVIVGAGPAGLSLATGLRRRGVRVLVLEGGPQTASRETPFNDAEVVGLPFTGAFRRGRGLGGGTSQWAGQCMRFHAADFEKRPWIAESGWPLSVDELLPYYAEAEQYLGVTADGYHGSVWRKFGIEPGTLIESRVALRFSVFCREAELFRRDRKALELDPGLVLLYNATVTELRRTDNRVTALHVSSQLGRRETIPVDMAILCVGAIETARMLLQPSVDFPQGVGTDSGHVGRHFQDHPNGVVAEILPQDATAFERIPDLFSLFYRSKLRYLPRMVMSTERQRSLGTLNGCALPVFEWAPDSLTEDVRQLQAAVAGRRFDRGVGSRFRRVWREPAALGATVLRRLQGRSSPGRPDRIKLHLHIEQDPATTSSIGLSHRLDPLGRPLARVDWRLGDLELRTIRHLTEEINLFLGRNGLGRLRVDPALGEGGSEPWRDLFHDNQHHAGTARMSGAEQGGVVDENCKIFGLANVYIAGGAVFPTGSYANPTLTMVALAFRLAAHLSPAARRATT